MLYVTLCFDKFKILVHTLLRIFLLFSFVLYFIVHANHKLTMVSPIIFGLLCHWLKLRRKIQVLSHQNGNTSGETPDASW